MMWIIVIFSAVIAYCVFYNIRLKQYNQSGLRAEEDNDLKNQLKDLLHLAGIDPTNKVFVNGHFIEQSSLVLTKTTYYSYILLFDKESGPIEVYSYLPDDKKIELVGSYPVDQITPKPYSSVGTNYLFHDKEGKHLFTVQTLAEVLPGSSEYQISYGQKEEYQALRSRFHLT